MFFNTTDYARNKMDPKAIVYRDVFGSITRITSENFESEEEFLLWKELSDDIYHEIEKEDHRFRSHTLSLEGLAEGAVTVDSPEAILIAEVERDERRQVWRLLTEGMDTLLTETQRTRLYLHCADRMSARSIAHRQGVNHKAVLRSVYAAKKIIQDFFKTGAPKCRFHSNR